MMSRVIAEPVAPAQRLLRIGSVSFLNAKPLIEGLDADSDVALQLDVPSRLLAGLRSRRFDVALLPVIDYQRMDNLVVVPAGGIGSDGPTLTVRIFSRVPVERMTLLACDTDSHTSVALARVILDRAYGIRPRFVDQGEQDAAAEALLLIGDKVVCEEPLGYPYQLDLGEAWKTLTGLPFVFAAWMARPDVDLPRLHERLTESKRRGRAAIKSIIQTYALPRGWPGELARQYLTRHLCYDIGARELEAIRRFHQLAHDCGILPEPPRTLEVFSPPV